jgi:hypothetical protein
LFNKTTHHEKRRLGFVQVLRLGIDPGVPALRHRAAPILTVGVVATLTSDQGSEAARRIHVDFAVVVVAVFGLRTDWHNTGSETKSKGGLVQRHVNPLKRGGQEVGMFSRVGIGVRKPNGDDMALREEVWFPQSGLNRLVEREGGGIQSSSKAGEMSNAAGDVQVVRQGDPMAGFDFQDLVFAVAVKSRPFDARLGVGTVR